MITHFATDNNKNPEILIITSYPPRECGIATYSNDLVTALKNKFNGPFNIEICAVENNSENHSYPDKTAYILNTDEPGSFSSLAMNINENPRICLVVIQHEFGFYKNMQDDFLLFINAVKKPVITAFHTVIPKPEASLKNVVYNICSASESIIVMTNDSAKILSVEYNIPKEKIKVIPHGTHLVPHTDKEQLKQKYNLAGKQVLSTFGLLSSGKSIETTLYALPEITRANPDVVFLIIGKTHPAVIKQEGFRYYNMLDEIVRYLKIQDHVKYLNYYLPLPELLDYLQLTDIYLFTSKDPNQAVSGTFSYALSCGCPIVSTPIPHALEVLKNDAGIIIDFENPAKLSEAVTGLLNDKVIRNNISSNGLHRIAPTAWENSAIAHAMLFNKAGKLQRDLSYKIPEINLNHIKRLTTETGMIQFSKLNCPDLDSGYTLDDNARALIAMCQHYQLTKNADDLVYIQTYLDFIKFCQQPDGNFLNYVDKQRLFTKQNDEVNLADAYGRTIWALGFAISLKSVLPSEIITEADLIIQKALVNAASIHSTRAMAFTIKGLFYNNTIQRKAGKIALIRKLADRLVQMFRHESDKNWRWYESYLTYANGILPEALLLAWLATGDTVYKEIAKLTFDFLLSKTFIKNRINVISNIGWLNKDQPAYPDDMGAQQPIDVSYTILALNSFFAVFKNQEYLDKMQIAFNWFLGNNHLNQVIYNPCTGGCYDGLEKNYVNLNQGAESAVSYLMARLTVEKTFKKIHPVKIPKEYELHLLQ